MILNERYTGKVVVNDELFTNIFPPIISTDMFDKVRKAVEGNKRMGNHFKSNIKFLLTGKAYCGYCGEKMTGESGTSHTGKTHAYYKCLGMKKKKNDCSCKIYKKDELEKQVVDLIKTAILNSDILYKIACAISDAYNLTLVEDAELKLNEKELLRNKHETDNIINAIAAGIVTSAVKEKLVELENEKEALELEHVKLKSKVSCKISPEDAFSFLNKLIAFDDDSDSYRERLINNLLREVRVFNDKIVILLYPLEDHSVFASDNNPSNNTNNNNSDSGDLENMVPISISSCSSEFENENHKKIGKGSCGISNGSPFENSSLRVI